MLEITIIGILVVCVLVLFYKVWSLEQFIDIVLMHRYDELKKSVKQTKKRIKSSEKKFDDKYTSLMCLTTAITCHLHASGTVYSTRIWDTWQHEMSEKWKDVEREYPSYLPSTNNPFHDASGIDIGEYNQWKKNTQLNWYYKNPRIRISGFPEDGEQLRYIERLMK